MKKRYIEEQIIKAIKRRESGVKVDEICGDLGISAVTFCNWRRKYAGLEVNDAKRLKAVESENHKLKRMLPDKLLEVEAMNDVISKSGEPSQTPRGGEAFGWAVWDQSTPVL